MVANAWMRPTQWCLRRWCRQDIREEIARRSSTVSLPSPGSLAALVVMTVITALCTGVGPALAGSDALTPMAGTFALGLFAAAVAGIGFAVGGLVGASLAPRSWPSS